MAGIKNILILQKSKSLPDGLRELLRTAGYVAHTVFNLSSAAEKLEEIQMGLILIDCGEDPETTNELLIDLSKKTNLCEFPTVLITPISDELGPIFDKSFLLARSVELPCEASAVLDAINQLNAKFDEYLEKLMSRNPALAEAVKEAEEARLTFIEETNFEFDDISRGNLLRDFIAESGDSVSQAECTRASLVLRVIDEALLYDEGIIPQNEHVEKIFIDICATLSSRKKTSVFRNSLLTGISAQSLGILDEDYNRLIAAQLVFQQKLQETGATLSRSNYLVDKSNRIKKELAKVIVSSSEDSRIAELDRASDLLMSASELLRGVRASESSVEDLSASTMILGDLIERTCFTRGFWDPRGSYQLLTRFKNGSLSHLNQRAVMKVMLYLGSFLKDQKITMLLPARDGYDRSLWKETIKKQNGMQPKEHERLVALNELGKGMILSRPLESLDGKRILEAGVELDNDLIFRILELSSMRGLILPLFIESDSATR